MRLLSPGRAPLLLRASLAVNVIFLLVAVWRVVVRMSWTPDSFEAYRTDRRELLQTLAGPQGPVFFLGDSLTERGEWAERFGQASVLNRGIAGDTTGDVLARLDAIIARRPRAIFLMVGVNDLSDGDPPPVVLLRYAHILDRIRGESPATTVVVQSVLPVNPRVGRPSVDNARIDELNEGLRRLARDGRHVYLDVAARLRAADGSLDPRLTRDGIHLTAAGYSAWTEAARSALPRP